jgi:hypothetical protein
MEGAPLDWSTQMQVPENEFGLSGTVQDVTDALLAMAQL